ncbi:MAG: glycine cleavage system aminomethyltransferase GcvT [Nitrososphaerota archaeon]|nr:glycine cleavage system aminomethyltransferase GcvT [Nitrososphaerota archaeon]
MKRTQLYDYHASHAKLTEFAGYEMPVWYTTTPEEHMAVRTKSGIFDVSHMGRFTVKGKDSGKFLEGLVPTRVQSQPNAKSFYTLLLNDKGGIADDLIIVRKADEDFLVVVNAANASRDLGHMRGHMGGYDVELDDVTSASAMIALQGPEAAKVLQPLVPTTLNELKRFRSVETEVLGEKCTLSRTGYTGEDGFEMIVYDATLDDPSPASKIWNELAKVSKPCGLGARDSLRLEAGYPLHGSDIDEETNPFEADLAWVLSADKTGYVGSEAISESRTRPPSRVRKGVVLDEGVPRHGFEVLDVDSRTVGHVTSGTFSPILRKGVALARVSADVGDQTAAWVKIRDSKKLGHYVKPPFYDEKLYGWKRQRNGI